jgi:hypothetical protein
MILKEGNSIMINGHGELVNSAFRTLWAGNTIIRPMESGRQKLKLASSSNDDSETGTGAQYVRITGLTEALEPIDFQAALNGQTEVLIEDVFAQINMLEVIQAGNSKKNAGIISIGTGTVSSGVPAVSFEKIHVGYSISHTMRYTVGTGKRLYINRLDLSRTVDVPSLINVVKKVKGLTTILDSFSFQTGDPSHTYQVPLVIRSGETVCIEGKKNSGSAADVYCELYGEER